MKNLELIKQARKVAVTATIKLESKQYDEIMKQKSYDKLTYSAS